jgi:glyoxylase-like metal-dependent hydrolase (beta-lactamase superfamily II)
MFWFLKGENGRNILVDAGYIDSSKTVKKDYERPDEVLKRLNISPSDITDIIITHPHFDHIGGIILFPQGKVWMQKKTMIILWEKPGRKKDFQEDFRKMMSVI